MDAFELKMRAAADKLGTGEVLLRTLEFLIAKFGRAEGVKFIDYVFLAGGPARETEHAKN